MTRITNLTHSKILLIIICVFATNPLLAQDLNTNDNDGSYGRMFIGYESNGLNSISTLGMGIQIKTPSTPLGFQLNTAVGVGNVITYNGINEDYALWEVSGRMGYFDTFSIYFEAGIDLAELLFNDNYYDDYHDYDPYYSNSLDFYFGVGGGFMVGPVGIDATIRWREVSSDYWSVQEQVYSGVQMSLAF